MLSAGMAAFYSETFTNMMLWAGKPVLKDLPLLLSEDRTKLSKRQGGYLSQTGFFKRIYFKLLLGWNPGPIVPIFLQTEFLNFWF